ncbi:hypothetical protein QYF36_003198 [Acer negundo]|nr:hypothetical protein QYF36_003198 [Acer negundo]
MTSIATGTPTTFHGKSDQPAWILDSGTNNHMTGPTVETSVKDSPLLMRSVPIFEPSPQSFTSSFNGSLPPITTTNPL